MTTRFFLSLIVVHLVLHLHHALRTNRVRDLRVW